MDEIHRPTSVRLGFDQDRRPRPHGAPPSPSLAHRQAFFAIKPVDAVDARGLALLPQQDEQSPIAEALPFVGEIAQMRPKFCVRRSALSIADTLATRVDDRTGPPFRQAHHGLKMRDAFALDGGPYHFFDRSSRSAAASSICSAKSFFSLAFSSSSWLSRLASVTSMPPYLAFQLYSVASETPCLRARSADFAPASCSRSTPIICSSVNLARFICPSFTRPDSNSTWRKFAVAGQPRSARG